jgi:hypothetical protein
MPIGRINIEVSAKRHSAREQRMDLYLRGSSRGHDDCKWLM